MYKIKDITNKIIYGDNLIQMKQIPDETIDLIYLDPPFFSDFNYESFWGDEQKHKDWDSIYKEDGRRTGGIENYVAFMRERLEECYRILKLTGSIFLHCDNHANHHLRMEMDEIFNVNNFKNEIVWLRKSGTGSPKMIAHSHDVILYYTKSRKATFNQQYLAYSEEYIKRQYNKTDDVGVYRIHEVIAGPGLTGGGMSYTYKKYTSQRWLLSKEKIKEMDEDNRIVWSKTGRPYRKLYLHERKGVPLGDVWLDIKNVQGEEHLGYKTQKPEALLERIINLASNEGDVVLDPFCGCGTTIAVSNKLNRSFIGIDWSEMACRVMAERLGYAVDDVVGLPKTMEDFDGMDGFLFQKWMCFYLGAKSNPKERGDKGIDGWFPDGTLLQTKMGKVGPKIVNEFSSVIQRYGKNGKGVIASYAGFTKGAERAIVDIARKLEIVIILITTKDILSKDFSRFEDVVGHEKTTAMGVVRWFWKVPKGRKRPMKKEDVVNDTLIFLKE